MGQVITVTTSDGETYTHENPKRHSVTTDGWLLVEDQGAVGSVIHHYPAVNVCRFSLKQTPED